MIGLPASLIIISGLTLPIINHQETPRHNEQLVEDHSFGISSEYLASSLPIEFIENVEGDTLSFGDGYGRVPYYYRYLVYDRNRGDWDYIYVFRLGVNVCPSLYRHFFSPWWWCPSRNNLWIFPVTYWKSYVKNGSMYYEFLFGKTTVDSLTCYGYIEMEFWF